MDIVKKSLFEDSICQVSWPVWVLLAVGAIGVSKILLNAFRAFYYVFGPSNNVKKYGQWAVVTGATDGIGLAFAKVLHKKNINVVIVGRREEGLEKAKADILSYAPKSTAAVNGVLADLDKPGYQESIAQAIADIEVGILINNAGLSYDGAEYLAELPAEKIQSLVNVNVLALTNITKLVLPGMVARKKGLIINIGSAAGLMSIGDPLYAVYSGTKAFVDRFSRSLNVEYASKGIHTEVCIPYFVVSKMSKIRKPTLMAPTAETFAERALARSGRGSVSIPYLPHAAQHALLESLPTFAQVKLVMGHHLDVYKRVQKKKLETAKKQ